MATIYDEITAPIIAEKWTDNSKERTPFLGEALFPQRKQLGIELSYFQGHAPKVRPLDLSSFDAKAIPLSREAFAKISTEMPFFKNFMDVNEKQRQQLNMVLASGNRTYIDSILNVIFDDESRLLANADVTREMLRMQLMTSGAIAFASNGQAISYDFGVPSENKKQTNWHTTTTADPIKDINDWLDDVENATGSRPSNILMNRNTLRLFVNANSIKNALYVFANGTVTPNTTSAQRLVEQETNTRIYVYDKGYTDETTGKFTKFVADDVVVIFPDTVGEGVFGTTPEESDLMSGATDAVVSIVDTGVAITTTKETDPVNVKTKVSMIYLPVLTNPELLVIADVNHTTGG
jgi:hypothetical protein|nr:MAG TPA: Major capsid protein [Caudoviricetes sp.]